MATFFVNLSKKQAAFLNPAFLLHPNSKLFSGYPIIIDCSISFSEDD